MCSARDKLEELLIKADDLCANYFSKNRLDDLWNYYDSNITVDNELINELQVALDNYHDWKIEQRLLEQENKKEVDDLRCWFYSNQL